MSMYRFYLTALMAGLLAGCGGGDPVVPADEESDSGSGDDGEGVDFKNRFDTVGCVDIFEGVRSPLAH